MNVILLVNARGESGLNPNTLEQYRFQFYHILFGSITPGQEEVELAIFEFRSSVVPFDHLPDFVSNVTTVLTMSVGNYLGALAMCLWHRYPRCLGCHRVRSLTSFSICEECAIQAAIRERMV